MAKIEQLVAGIDRIPDATAQADVKELLQLVLDLHGTGLERILDLIHEAGLPGESILAALSQDDLVSQLLLLHGLHPLDAEARIRLALDRVRPYMHTHKGDVQFLGVTEEGIVRLQWQGTCRSCSGSTVTLHQTLEQAIYDAAPEVKGVEIEGADELQLPMPANFIPISELMAAPMLASTGSAPRRDS
jgi:Fe-S cluster biogenesis protein NfuA